MRCMQPVIHHLWQGIFETIYLFKNKHMNEKWKILKSQKFNCASFYVKKK
jgi:uncharacterized membrane protein HdeD (DUF308 family)